MSLLSQGIDLMVAGMVTVFTFLTLLVLCTTLMSRVLARLAPEPAPAADAPRVESGEAAPSTAELAAMAAAIEQHRRERR